MPKSHELVNLLKTGNSDAARKAIAKLKKAGKKKALAKELNTPDDQGQNVIHYCAVNNFIEFLQDLAELGAVVDNADDKGYTPLHVAAAAGRASAVSTLLGHGADPNTAARSGDTPLHLACNNAHIQAVEALVSESANCTMLNVSGNTPLDLACQSGNAQVVSVLLRSGQFSQSYLSRSDMPHTALLIAAKQGHNEIIGLLVRQGFDVNRKLPGSSGTCLHEAALYGKVDTVRYLLQCGADVAALNGQGHTALDIVNMYTDPRSAGLMKQVLQDALGQQARARMAQQHVMQSQHYQPHPSAGRHVPPTSTAAHHTPPMTTAGYHTPPTPTSAHHTPPTPTSTHKPQGFSYLQMGFAPQAQRQAPPQSSPAHQRLQGGREERAHTYSGHQSYNYQPYHHQQQQQQARAHPQSREQHQYGHEGQRHMPVYAQPQAVRPSHHQQPHQQLHHGYASLQSHEQPPVSAPSGYAGTEKRDSPTVGLAGAPDLAAMIAAKAASRKQIVTSPTSKYPEDDRMIRSATISSGNRTSDIIDARHIAQQAAMRRRNSFSDRSSSSPDRDWDQRSNPPTLPRRGHGGPPQFKPIPPPMEGSLSHSAEQRHSQYSNRSDHSPSPELRGGSTGSLPQRQSSEVEKPKLRKVQPSRPPPAQSSSVDNELLQKLKRRQNKIQEAQQAPQKEEEVEAPAEDSEPQAPPPPEEPAPPPTKPPTGKPPPIPERKTAQLSTQAEPKEAPEITSEVPPSLPKMKKPPPVQPKEEPPELSPWQAELMARKQRKSPNSLDAEMKQNLEKGEEPVSEDPPTSDEPAPEKSVEPETEKPVEPAPKKLVKPPPKPLVKPPAKAQVKEPVSKPVKVDNIPVFEPVKPVKQVKEPVLKPVQPVEEQASPAKEALVAPVKEPGPPPVKEPGPPPIKEPGPPPVKEPVFQPPRVEDLGRTTEPPVDEVIEKSAASATPTGDQLSRSTSVSSLSTTTGTGSPLPAVVEPVPIAEWLSSYKLGEYTSSFVAQGYDSTDFLSGISHEELVDLGVQKIGHRKKVLSALSSFASRDSFLSGTQPANVPAWLSALGLSQYEGALLDAGYDDIDFVCEISVDELCDIGVTKKGHLKRLMKGIAEMADMQKSLQPVLLSPPPISKVPEVNGAILADEAPLPPPSQPEPVEKFSEVIPPPLEFARSDQKPMAEELDLLKAAVPQVMGSRESLESEEGRKVDSRSPSGSPQVQRRMGKPPPPIPKRSAVTSLSGRQDSLGLNRHSLSSSTSSLSSNPSERATTSIEPPKLPPKRSKRPSQTTKGQMLPWGVSMTDGGEEEVRKSYSIDDINSALDSASGQSVEVGSEDTSSEDVGYRAEDEMDQLSRALQGFEAEQPPEEEEGEAQTEQLLADIDDMLADLNTHLDFIIPGSS